MNLKRRQETVMKIGWLTKNFSPEYEKSRSVQEDHQVSSWCHCQFVWRWGTIKSFNHLSFWIDIEESYILVGKENVVFSRWYSFRKDWLHASDCCYHTGGIVIDITVVFEMKKKGLCVFVSNIASWIRSCMATVGLCPELARATMMCELGLFQKDTYLPKILNETYKQKAAFIWGMEHFSLKWCCLVWRNHKLRS